MHSRRFTALLLGLWLGASLLMDWVSMSAFSTVAPAYESLQHREPVLVREIGPEPTRRLLRFQSAEVNRYLTYVWGWAQCAFGVILLLVVLFSTNGHKLMLGFSAAMLLMALAMQFGVMPSMIEQDRKLDFATTEDLRRDQAIFNGSHNTYVGMEIFKLVAGLGLAGTLLYQRSDSRRRRRSSGEVEINSVNYPHNSRINR